MARNAEKACSMLNRWLAVKEGIIKGFSPVDTDRPRNSQVITTVRECERIRSLVMNDISRKVIEIKNENLTDESKIRELNDEINTLLKEKYKWECRIVELGGPEHRIRYNQYIESLGGISIPNSTYKYFGRAKALYESQYYVTESDLKMKSSLPSSMPYQYYGLFNNDEEVMTSIEREKEKELVMQMNLHKTSRLDISIDEGSRRDILKLIEKRKEELDHITE
ncbi:Isy1-like splicing family protein [Cryptosporidium muris RN66]|uniref:Isy1-like splicing family protein n=1 Tax=Cryptosporidium muris (strain RN66) TaxID=441375 RepID=B6A9P4_CRYMR|nr:Isy1-like splicing family protein [Cryptosporidium muris RN66]EEA04935.1 Isy1-like splicing family protein [Cryptosporidium muris RN66]|eukprot:XP_002139284.1 Isy1-like splicing family protein [Cryptosporidium muris RN66]